MRVTRGHLQCLLHKRNQNEMIETFTLVSLHNFTLLVKSAKTINDYFSFLMR